MANVTVALYSEAIPKARGEGCGSSQVDVVQPVQGEWLAPGGNGFCDLPSGNLT